MKSDLLKTWIGLNEKVTQLSADECQELLDLEIKGKQRKMFMLRLHSRINKLRAHDEQAIIIGEKQMPEPLKSIKAKPFSLNLYNLHGLEVVYVNGLLSRYSWDECQMVYIKKQWPCKKCGDPTSIKKVSEFSPNNHFCKDHKPK